MKNKVYLCSFVVLLTYCVVIVFLPNFELYVAFRGYILPALLSVVLTAFNFVSVRGKADYAVKLVIFIVLGYALRLLVFFACNGYFDVNFLHLKNDWYLLYIIMQIPSIIISSLFTLAILKLIEKRKSEREE